MNISLYTSTVLALAKYPNIGRNPQYPALGLIGESGEVAEIVKKMHRDSGGELTDEACGKLLHELGDVLWYISALASEIGTTLSGILMTNDFADFARLDPHDGTVYDPIHDMFTLSKSVGRIAGLVDALTSPLISAPHDIIPVADRNAISSYLFHATRRVSRLGRWAGFTLHGIATANIAKLTSRNERGVIGGNGSDR